MSQTSKELGAAHSSRDAAEDAAPTGLTPLEAEMLEALKMADALLSGANMNERVVEKKVRAAIAKAEGAS